METRPETMTFTADATHLKDAVDRQIAENDKLTHELQEALRQIEKSPLWDRFAKAVQAYNRFSEANGGMPVTLQLIDQEDGPDQVTFSE